MHGREREEAALGSGTEQTGGRYWYIGSRVVEKKYCLVGMHSDNKRNPVCAEPPACTQWLSLSIQPR